ncbi:unnamed protein product [Spirodela intermedia]|uniref:Uncharacterized protein n=1 Tax=Spirodela intermedia TaxID=51605 RepID=A0A7I8ISI7_SPIIN|nr:unnamed protein product [Spirodela intermedia]CAA6659923.1 unnamed protein product [Spirodela intermedia]
MDGGPPQPQQDDCGDAERARSMWRHLPLLVRASSKDSVEYILRRCGGTRATGLRLRRPCYRVYGNVPRDEIQKLFPEEVSIPRLKAMTWNMVDQTRNPAAMSPDTLQTMLKSMFCIRDQLYSAVSA